MCEKHNLPLASGIVSSTAYQNTPAPLSQQNLIPPKTEHANRISAHARLQMLKEVRRGSGDAWSPQTDG